MAATPAALATPPRATNSTIDHSTTRYLFTPKPGSKLPRAWERKPSTPFARRNETQKIWKRVELQEVMYKMTDGQSQYHVNMQAVKRLRPDQEAWNADEVGYISTQWHEEYEDIELKRKERKELRRRQSNVPPIQSVVRHGDEGRPEYNNNPATTPLETKPDTTSGAVEIETPQTPPESTEPGILIADTDADGEATADLIKLSPKAAETQVDGCDQATTSNGDASLALEYPVSGTGNNDEHEMAQPETIDTTDRSTIRVAELPVIDAPQNTSSLLSMTESAPVAGDMTEESSEEHLDESEGERISTPVVEQRTQPAGQEACEVQDPDVLSKADHTTKSPTGATATFVPRTEKDLAPRASMHAEDTDYLQAFLTRAKAKKAEQKATSPRKATSVGRSPMTRSRAALMPLSANSPSRVKPQKIDLPAEGLQNTGAEENTDEKASSPCRRSTRTRLPRPQKAPVVTPSTIPVRRSNGSEFVFLQRTESQQIALDTRLNTRRNKGEAVVPKAKLQALAEQPAKSPSKSPKKRSGTREVTWNDVPFIFRAQADDNDVGEAGSAEVSAEVKPAVRKARRLGTVNGTPAPKRRMAEHSVPLAPPVSKRRGKAKA